MNSTYTKKIILLSSLIFFNSISFAWEGHHLITYPAIIATNDNFYKQLVQVESLESFLKDTKDSLPNELMQIEKWAKNTQTGYQKLPDNLIYNPQKSICNKDLILCFKSAIRINWDVPLISIIYDPQQLTNFNFIANLSQLMLNQEIPDSSTLMMQDQFKYVTNNDIVPLISVIAAGSQEPDFGLDIGLYQDSNTNFGAIYGFGRQPIGDVSLKITSQVLFHAATYSMPRIFFYFRSGLRSSYPQYRFYAYMHLAQLAKKAGHLYWAARFTGWALHYLQDLTQPYHANLLLGFNTLEVVVAEMTSIINKGYINAIQNKIEARHIVSENVLGALLSKNNHSFPYEKEQLNNFLKDAAYDKLIKSCNINNDYIIDEVNVKTISIGDNYSKEILKVFPASIINNPNGINYMEINYLQLYGQLSREAQHHLLDLYTERLGYTAAYTRSCINQVFLE